jgi:hypothetical protein
VADTATLNRYFREYYLEHRTVGVPALKPLFGHEDMLARPRNPILAGATGGRLAVTGTTTSPAAPGAAGWRFSCGFRAVLGSGNGVRVVRVDACCHLVGVMAEAVPELGVLAGSPCR